MREDKIQRYTHTLTLTELEAMVKFVKERNLDSVDVEITPTGLGNVVIVRERTYGENVPYVSLNVSDYDSW